MTSHLLTSLKAEKFIKVTIGNKVYGDDDIISLSINYGKSSSSLALAVPTATIEIYGNVPLSYNSDVKIETEIKGIESRFIGRVGSQELEDSDTSDRVSRIIATSHTIRIFRDNTTFNAYNEINTLGHAVNFMFDRSKSRKVPGGTQTPSSRMWAEDYFRRGVYKSKDVLGIFESLGIGVLHTRSGGVVFHHPLDRIQDMRAALLWSMPLQRSEALSPAMHEQATSYLDARPRLVYWRKGEESPRYADLFSRYMRGVEIPTATDDKEIKEFVYTTDSWRYTAMIHLMQQSVNKWNTPRITVDLLGLKTGTPYEKEIFKQLVNTQEGEFIIFSGDWERAFRGAKVVQGIEEKITAESWDITFSLANPEAVLGWSELDTPMPKPLELTWAQQTGRWADQKERWENIGGN